MVGLAENKANSAPIELELELGLSLAIMQRNLCTKLCLLQYCDASISANLNIELKANCYWITDEQGFFSERWGNWGGIKAEQEVNNKVIFCQSQPQFNFNSS